MRLWLMWSTPSILLVLPVHSLKSIAFSNSNYPSVDFNAVNERPPTLIMNDSVIDMTVPAKTKRIVEKDCTTACQFESIEGRVAWLCPEKVLSNSNELSEMR